MKFLKESDFAPADIFYTSGYIGQTWPSVNQKKFADTKVIATLQAFIKDVQTNEKWATTSAMEHKEKAERWLNAYL